MQGLYPPADMTGSKTSYYGTKYCFGWDIGRLTRLNMALVTGGYYIHSLLAESLMRLLRTYKTASVHSAQVVLFIFTFVDPLYKDSNLPRGVDGIQF